MQNKQIKHMTIKKTILLSLMLIVGIALKAQQQIEKGIVINGDNSGGSPYLLFRNYDGNHKFGMQYWNGGLNIYRPGQPSSGDGTFFIDYSSGNVGIGTPSPKQCLHVFRANANNYLKLDKTNSGYENGVEFAYNGGAQFFIFTDNDGTNDLKIQASGLDGENDATPRMKLPKSNKNILLGLSGGNVGIGTDAPEQSLHIYKSNARNYLKLDKTSSGFETGMEFANGGKVQFFIFTDDGSDDLKIQASGLNGENDGAPRIWIPKSNKNLFLGISGGNVGIGTTNPTAKLEVNGMIKAEQIKVVNDVPASDYVFEPDYNLRSLEEVESFVKENKHLPEVPSAAEFEENGYSIGEMDDVLLRKIEELTLYMIEQNKKLHEKDKTIEGLNKRIEALEKK